MSGILSRIKGTHSKSSSDVPESVDWSLPFNHVQWKAAHNSIERKESLYDQLEEGKCRALELDFFVDPSTVQKDKWKFAVQHDKEISPQSPALEQCLEEIKLWSSNNPGHVPLTIHLDMKDSKDSGEDTIFVEQLNTCILSVFSREQLFTPVDLKGDFPSLLESVKTYGWPKLQLLQDKFLFVITGTESQNLVRKRRQAYCESSHQLAFVDLDQRYCSKVNEPECEMSPQNRYYLQGDRVFLNVQLGRNDWKKLAVLGHHHGFLTRLWKTNSHSDWKAAKACKINFLATDKILGHTWAFMPAGCHLDIVPDPKFVPMHAHRGETSSSPSSSNSSSSSNNNNNNTVDSGSSVQ